MWCWASRSSICPRERPAAFSRDRRPCRRPSARLKRRSTPASSRCIDEIVSDQLLDGPLPENGQRCSFADGVTDDGELSDDLFALFLDPGMTYSSGLFAPGDTLAAAQHRKIDALLDRTGTGPGSTDLPTFLAAA